MRRTLVLLAAACLAGCGAEENDPAAELGACGGSLDNVVAWTEATPDVQCIEALAFVDHVVGYTIAPSPCFEGGEYGGAVVSPCLVNGWRCEIEDRGEPPRGMFDCVDEDRDRRMLLTAFYPLDERPESWDATVERPPDPDAAYRRLHLLCRDWTLDELAGQYGTAAERGALLTALAGAEHGDAAAHGCRDGFRARDVLGRSVPTYLDSSE